MKKEFIPLFTKVRLETHSHCNRDCSFCSRFNDRSGIRKDSNGKKVEKRMPTEQVYRLLDELAAFRYTGWIGFHRLSEPMLDRRYVEFATRAKELGMKIWENSNGDVLARRPDLIEQIDGLVDHLIIGLYDYETPAERQVLEQDWLARFKQTRIEFSAPWEEPASRFSSDMEIDDTQYNPKQQLNCRAPSLNLLIRYDGEVSLCGQDDACEFELGNVFEQSIASIWWSPKHIGLVRGLLEPGGRMEHAFCRGCRLDGCQLVQPSALKTRIRSAKELLWEQGLISLEDGVKVEKYLHTIE